MEGVDQVDALVVAARAVQRLLQVVGAVEDDVARARASGPARSSSGPSGAPVHLPIDAPALDAVVAGDLGARRHAPAARPATATAAAPPGRRPPAASRRNRRPAAPRSPASAGIDRAVGLEAPARCRAGANSRASGWRSMHQRAGRAGSGLSALRRTALTRGVVGEPCRSRPSEQRRPRRRAGGRRARRVGGRERSCGLIGRLRRRRWRSGR